MSYLMSTVLCPVSAAWPALMVAIFLIGCSDGASPFAMPSPDPSPPVPPADPAPPVSTFSPPPESLTAVPYNTLATEVVDQECTPAGELESGTALFHNERTYRFLWTGECSPDELRPLTGPDGRQLTAGEWVEATGQVTISCIDGGTRYDFRLQGLISNGVYSVWHNLRPTEGAGGAFGALASHPGDIRNSFTATTSGTVDFSVTGSAGRMTVHGSVPSCTLPIPSRPETYRQWSWIFSLVYHKDNRAPGIDLPLETAISHLAFEGR